MADNKSYADNLSELAELLKKDYRDNLFEVCIKMSNLLSSMLYDLKKQEDAKEKELEWG